MPTCDSHGRPHFQAKTWAWIRATAVKQGHRFGATSTRTARGVVAASVVTVRGPAGTFQVVHKF